MYKKIIRTLWGELHGDELKKFLLLSLGFFFLIGSYWPLKTLKDSIFVNTVGASYVPIAKLLSLVMFFPLVLIYSKLIDVFSKQKMVYLLVTIYMLLGFVFVYFFYHPTIGLQNTVADPSRKMGWLFFLYAESYVSLMVSLFWSYTHDITTPEAAKRGYGLIIFGTQLGGFILTLIGNILSADTSKYATRAPIIALISISMFLAIAVVTFFLQKVIKNEDLQSYQEAVHDDKEKSFGKKKPSIGFLDGLRVLVTRPYVAGIFMLIFFHESISSIMWYHMLSIATTTYHNPGLLNKFLFDYALAVQAVACLFGLVGTSFFQRRFGIKFCLVAYPIVLGSSIICYLYWPTLPTICVVMIIAKALNYAFNQPAKEVLYIPTSKNIKYKSKAWIDMFGMRFSKAAGHFINKMVGVSIGFTGPIILLMIGLWIFLSNAVGNRFKKAVDKNEIID